MNQRSFSLLAGIIFIIIALLHLLRIIYGWDLHNSRPCCSAASLLLKIGPWMRLISTIELKLRGSNLENYVLPLNIAELTELALE